MEEKILFKNSKGDNLSGIVSSSLGDKRKIVILCHGLNSNKNNRANLAITQKLDSEKIDTFRFDFFAHGESEGNISGLTVSGAVDDLINAFNLIKERGYSEIGLFGSSFGGMASLIASTKLKNIKFLILKSPVSDLKKTNIIGEDKKVLNDWKMKGLREYALPNGKIYSLKYSFFEDLGNNNVYSMAENVDVPTLILHGSLDNIVPVDQSIRLSETIKGSKLEIIENADHSYTKEKDFDKMLNIAIPFILKEFEK